MDEPKKTSRLRKTTEPVLDLKTSRCRRCQQIRDNKKFYQATDKILDTNGYMSICIYCCTDLYNGILVAESMNVDRAIFKMCRMLNARYEQRAVEITKRDLEKSEKMGKPTLNAPVFGIYRKHLNSTVSMTSSGGIFLKDENVDLTFQPLDFSSVGAENTLEKFVELDSDREYLEKSWGKGMEIDDYLYLEESFAKWTKTTKCDTYAEELLVRELCHKENEIRKSRLQGSSTQSLVKELQEIMKNSALTPALQNAASSGRSAEAFGVWIRDIENLSPAEWFQDQDKYKDIEGIEEYNEKYITRAIKNFITGSRDFNVEGIISEDADDDGD